MSTTPEPPAAAGPEPEPRPSRLQRAAGAYEVVSDVLSPKTIGIALAALVLVVVAALGGLKSATAEAESAHKVPVVGVDRDITATPFTVQVHKAMQGAEIPGLVAKRDGERLIAVSIQITNNDTVPAGTSLGEPWSDAQPVRVQLDGLRWYGHDKEWEKAPPEAYRADSAMATTLQPGLRQRVVLVWHQATSQPVPKELTVVVSSQTHRASSLDGAMMWLDPTPVAKVSLPVTDLPKATR